MLLPSRNRLKSKSTEPKTAEQVYLYALRLLTARDYTAARLLAKLAVWSGELPLAEAVLSRLQDGGLVDDQRYAERFAESALASGRYVGSRLRIELRRRGVSAEVIEAALATVSAGFDEEAELRVALRKRYPGFVYAQSDDRQRRRVASFLQRRGYALALIMKVLRCPEEY